MMMDFNQSCCCVECDNPRSPEPGARLCRYFTREVRFLLPCVLGKLVHGKHRKSCSISPYTVPATWCEGLYLKWYVGSKVRGKVDETNADNNPPLHRGFAIAGNNTDRWRCMDITTASVRPLSSLCRFRRLSDADRRGVSCHAFMSHKMHQQGASQFSPHTRSRSARVEATPPAGFRLACLPCWNERRRARGRCAFGLFGVASKREMTVPWPATYAHPRTTAHMANSRGMPGRIQPWRLAAVGFAAAFCVQGKVKCIVYSSLV